MSLFDFLKDPNAGAGLSLEGGPQPVQMQQPEPQAAMPQVQQAPPEGLLQPPQQPAQGPGLLERFRTPGADGTSWADKLYAIGGILGKEDGPGAGMGYLSSKQKDFKAQKLAEQKQAAADKGNRAFRAAYQSGKFDPAVYAQMMGDDLDPTAFSKLAKAIGPEGGVSGSYAYKKNPLTGDIEWGGERPMDYAEHTAQTNSAETARHNGVTEGQGGARLGISQADLALARQREARLAGQAGGHGASTGLPPGYVPR